MDPFGAVRLGPGDYTIELLGPGIQSLTVAASGLPRSLTIRTTSPARGLLQTVQYGSNPTGSASLDRITLARRAGFVFQLQGSSDTVNPHAGGAMLCSPTATACASPAGWGSQNDFSGPWSWACR